jgi:hypothetical protein
MCTVACGSYPVHPGLMPNIGFWEQQASGKRHTSFCGHSNDIIQGMRIASASVVFVGWPGNAVWRIALVVRGPRVVEEEQPQQQVPNAEAGGAGRRPSPPLLLPGPFA